MRRSLFWLWLTFCGVALWPDAPLHAASKLDKPVSQELLDAELEDDAELAALPDVPVVEPRSYSYVLRNVIYGIPRPEQSEPIERIRVASYNIEHFTDGEDDGEERTPKRLANQTRRAAKIIDEIDPDILIVQEIENRYALRLLNNALDDPYPRGYITFFRHPWGVLDKQNLAILSRVPLIEVRDVRFSSRAGGGPRPPRGFISFVVELDDNARLLGYGAHLKSNYGDAARNQSLRRRALDILIEDMVDTIVADPGRHYEIVILGDFNTDPDNEAFAEDPSLEPLAEFVDLWRGRPIEERTTIPTRFGDETLEFPPAAFDRIFVCTNLAVAPWTAGPAQVLQKGCSTNILHLPGDKTHVSDHYPVFLDLAR